MSCPYSHQIENKYTHKLVTISCRKCFMCRLERQNDLEFQSFLAQQQGYKYGTGCSFVTLTYNQENVPLKTFEGDVYLTLQRKDFLKYFTNVKQYCRRNSLYVPQTLYCGEYGDEGRPHYHALIFGIDSNLMNSLNKRFWPLGISQAGALRPGGVRYVLDYVMKQNHEVYQKMYSSKGLESPFVKHSTKLGLDYFFNDFSYDNTDFTYIKKGHKVPIPSSYRKRLPGGDNYIRIDKNEAYCLTNNISLSDYNIFNAYDQQLHDVIKYRQRNIPVEQPSNLLNYVTTGRNYQTRLINKRNQLLNILKEKGLPTNKEFWLEKLPFVQNEQERKDLLGYIRLL